MFSRYRSSIGFLGEDLLDAPEAGDQAVDVVAGRVHRDRGARGGGNAEPRHEDLRAVVPGADADALAAEDLGDVVRVHSLHREGDAAAALVEPARAVDGEALDLAEPLQRV